MTRRMAGNLLLTLVTVALAAGALQAAQTPDAKPVAANRAASDVAPDPLVVRFAPPPAQRYAVIAKRPPFQSDRSPPRRAKPAAPVRKEVRKPSVAITGLMATGSTRRALLSVAGASPNLHAVGDDIAGWRLVEISQTGITLRRGQRTLSLAMGEEIQAKDAQATDPQAKNPEPAQSEQKAAGKKPNRRTAPDIREMIDE